MKTPFFLGSFALVALSLSACSGPVSSGDGGDVAVVSDAGSDANGDDASDVSADSGPPCEGRRRTFWTWDLTTMPPPDIEVDTGCRRETAHGTFYTTDDVWTTQVTEAEADTVMNAWENATPADPSRGIYAIDTALFGDPPDVDSDPHVALFYRPIGTFHGFTFDGYFRALDEDTTDPHSNATEMLHLNSGPRDIAMTYMLGVVAHEFVHLIASQYGDEDVWLSESLAEGGMVACGYLGDLSLAQRFAMTATAPLVGSSAGMDYGPLFLFADYLHERYGAAILADITRDTARGVRSVENALAMHGGGTFRVLFGEWATANYVDAPMPPYGYAAFDISTEAAAVTLSSGTATTGMVSPWAAGYYVIDAPAGSTSVTVEVTSASSANLEVHTAVHDSAARSAARVDGYAIAGNTSAHDVAVGTPGMRLVVIVANASTTAAPVSITATAH